MSIPRFPPAMVLFLPLSAFATQLSIAQDPCLDWTLVGGGLGNIEIYCQCQPPQAPSSGDYPMVFDPSHGVTVLYAKLGGGPQFDRFFLRARGWTQCTASGTPLDQAATRMAYDPVNQGVLLFHNPLVFQDCPTPIRTYFWDGTRFDQIAIGGPSCRSRYWMTTDTHRRRIVLFGGRETTANLNDTWEWDGTQWIQRLPSNSPSPRVAHSMTFDSVRNVVVMFGGEDNNGLIAAQTWEWNGVNWILRTPLNSPSRRSHPSMAFDEARGVVVLFGGTDINGPTNDTWEWDGVNWMQRITPNPPPPCSGAGMVYDSRRGKIVLLGNCTGVLYPSPCTYEYPQTPPVRIKVPPTAQSACVGDGPITLTVDAVGNPPLTYQWNRGGVALNLPGATTPTLTIPIADFGSAGDYTVVVTNSCGSVESAAASLTVCAGVSGCPSPVDVNGDGLIDGADIQRIVEVLLGL